MGGVKIKICGSLAEKIILFREEFKILQKKKKKLVSDSVSTVASPDVKSYPLSGLRFDAFLTDDGTAYKYYKKKYLFSV